MRYEAEFTTGARQDLLKICRYIKTDGRPETDKLLLETLTETCDGLSQNPERSHLPTELEDLS